MPALEALRMLGLAARSGAVVAGTQLVREAARRDALSLALIAADASRNSLEKVLPLLRVRGVPHSIVADRRALGLAVGKAPLSAVGITERGLARRIAELLESGGMKVERKEE